jgi:hypothetical protein
VSFTTITVTHTFLNADGTGAAGNIVWTLQNRMTNGTTSIMPAQPLTSSLDSSGNLSQALPANNDPATTPIGTMWQVTISINGCSPEQYAVVVPYNAAAGTVDLGSLLPEQQQVG